MSLPPESDIVTIVLLPRGRNVAVPLSPLPLSAESANAGTLANGEASKHHGGDKDAGKSGNHSTSS